MRRLCATAATVLLGAGLATAATQPTPSCFGAAARDPEHPCVNHALDLTVTPSPSGALLQPSAPCRIIRRAAPEVCGFGNRRAGAPAVALLGDSHALHWRAALAVMARDQRWQGVSLTHHRCPFSTARKPTIRCRGWVRSAQRWLTAHPSVHTIFVSADVDSHVVAPADRVHATKIAGFTAAWRALPPSVKEVFVLHDVPQSAYLSVSGCIERALAAHRNPGLSCARPRRLALLEDPQVTAALQAGDPRVKVIDLTPFMCDDASCFPVVGGVLVIKDHGHLTRTFSATLGPFVERAVTRLRGAARRRAAAPPVPTARAAAGPRAARPPFPPAPRSPARR